MVEERTASGAPPRRFPQPPRLVLVLAAWGLLVGSIQFYAWHEMITLSELLDRLVIACELSGIGPLLFVGAALLSPMLLVPAALLGGIAGACFGPALGICYTLVGCNLSALLTYSLGRLSRQKRGRIAKLCAKYGPHLRKQPFLSVVMLRLSFLPYDPVNYVIGLLRVRLWPFLLGNTLGSLPGVVAIVLAGNALGGLRPDVDALHPGFLLGAGVLVLSSLLVAVFLRKRVQ